MIQHLVINFDFLLALAVSRSSSAYRKLIKKANTDQLKTIILCLTLFRRDSRLPACTALQRLLSLRNWREHRVRQTILLCENSVRYVVSRTILRVVKETIQNVLCSC